MATNVGDSAPEIVLKLRDLPRRKPLDIIVPDAVKRKITELAAQVLSDVSAKQTLPQGQTIENDVPKDDDLPPLNDDFDLTWVDELPKLLKQIKKEPQPESVKKLKTKADDDELPAIFDALLTALLKELLERDARLLNNAEPTPPETVVKNLKEYIKKAVNEEVKVKVENKTSEYTQKEGETNRQIDEVTESIPRLVGLSSKKFKEYKKLARAGTSWKNLLHAVIGLLFPKNTSLPGDNPLRPYGVSQQDFLQSVTSIVVWLQKSSDLQLSIVKAYNDHTINEEDVVPPDASAELVLTKMTQAIIDHNQIKPVRDELAEFIEWGDGVQADYDRAKVQIDALKQKITKLESALAFVRANTGAGAQGMDQLLVEQQKRIDAETQYAELKRQTIAEKAISQTGYDQLHRVYTAQKKTIGEQETEIANKEREIQTLKQIRTDISLDLVGKNERLKRAGEEAERARKREEQLAEEVGTLKGRIAAASGGEGQPPPDPNKLNRYIEDASQLPGVQARASRLEAERDAEVAAREKLEKQIRDRDEAAARDQRDALITRLQKQVQDLQQTVSTTANAEILSLQTQLAAANRQLSQSTTATDALVQARLSEVKSDLIEKTKQEELALHKAIIKEDSEKVAKKIEALEHERSVLTFELAKQLPRANPELSKSEDLILIAEQKQMIEAAIAEINRMKKTIEDLQDSRKALNEAIDKAKLDTDKQLQPLQFKLNEAQSEAAKLAGKVSSLKSKNKNLKQLANPLSDSRVKQYEDQIRAQKGIEFLTNSLDTLIGAKRSRAEEDEVKFLREVERQALQRMLQGRLTSRSTESVLIGDSQGLPAPTLNQQVVRAMINEARPEAQ